MKATHFLLATTLYLVLVKVGYGDTQPNDNFEDRIVLTGNNVTFTGNLSGSTIEANEPIFEPHYFPPSLVTHSVWWSWTATESSPVTLVALSYSEDTYMPGFSDRTCALRVYEGTNFFGGPSSSLTNVVRLNAALNKVSMSFQAVAGTSYQIQFSGAHPTLAVTFQLIATNPPVILEPPTGQAIFPNGSALFTVIATGASELAYQWRLDGVDLPGATGPMLALDYVTISQAGAYSVAVSNSTGTAVAGPANLAVSSNPLQPLLSAGGSQASNAFTFGLSGESGRYYRIMSSTNLHDWSPEKTFSSTSPTLIYPPGANRYRSVVCNTNSNVWQSIPRSTNTKFVRASLYCAPNEICNNQLKQIRFAMHLWARSTDQARDWPATMNDLVPYCPGIGGFKCLEGQGFADSYWIGDICSDPQCQKAWTTHVLEEPR